MARFSALASRSAKTNAASMESAPFGGSFGIRRVARSESFDEQGILDLDSEALDSRAASEPISDIRKLSRRDLETLRLVVPHQGRKVLTVGGILFFGRDLKR